MIGVLIGNQSLLNGTNFTRCDEQDSKTHIANRRLRSFLFHREDCTNCKVVKLPKQLNRVNHKKAYGLVYTKATLSMSWQKGDYRQFVFSNTHMDAYNGAGVLKAFNDVTSNFQEYIHSIKTDDTAMRVTHIFAGDYNSRFVCEESTPCLRRRNAIRRKLQTREDETPESQYELPDPELPISPGVECGDTCDFSVDGGIVSVVETLPFGKRTKENAAYPRKQINC